MPRTVPLGCGEPPISPPGPDPGASLHLKRADLRPREGGCGGAPGCSAAQAPSAVPRSPLGTASPVPLSGDEAWPLPGHRLLWSEQPQAAQHSLEGQESSGAPGRDGGGRRSDRGTRAWGARGAGDSAAGRVGQPLLPGVLRRGEAASGAVGRRERGRGRVPARGHPLGCVGGDPSIKLEDGPQGVGPQRPLLPTTLWWWLGLVWAPVPLPTVSEAP